jgi:asparagine synthetase B (glutamine-hydrolysing)
MLLGAHDKWNMTGVLRSTETREFSFRWQGFAYLEGVLAGIPSIQRLAQEMLLDIPGAASRLKGIYFMYVHDKRSGTHYAFVDSSGLFHAFYSTRHVSTSFLALASSEGLRSNDLDAEALVEFFHFGYIGFGRTFFSSIRKIEATHILVCAAGDKMHVIPKPVPGIHVAPAHCLEEFMALLAASVGGETVSMDLTGGIDSRLMAVLLSYFGVPFEVAASGVSGTTDLVIAEQVAEVLDRHFHITYHHIDDFESTVPEIFGLGDGLFDVVRYHRAFQLQHDRISRGVSLVMSGTGGELFKDFWWLQDFPFYCRRKPDLQRLYSFRIAPVELKHSYLSSRYRGLSHTYRQRLLEKLSALVVPGNTQTYDQIYYSFKMRDYAGRFLTNTSHLVPCYAPYLERGAVAYGYHLPRSSRFFNNFHRRTMTRLCPEAANIETTEGGVSASSSTLKIAADLSKYVANRFGRLTRKVGQKVLRRSYLRDQSPDHPDLYSHVRGIIAERKSLQHLKETQIIDNKTELKEIEDRYLGNILTLSMLLDAIESSPGRESRLSLSSSSLQNIECSTVDAVKGLKTSLHTGRGYSPCVK